MLHVHADGSCDVKYILGGSERGVEAKYVARAALTADGPRRARSRRDFFDPCDGRQFRSQLSTDGPHPPSGGQEPGSRNSTDGLRADSSLEAASRDSGGRRGSGSGTGRGGKGSDSKGRGSGRGKGRDRGGDRDKGKGTGKGRGRDETSTTTTLAFAQRRSKKRQLRRGAAVGVGGGTSTTLSSTDAAAWLGRQGAQGTFWPGPVIPMLLGDRMHLAASATWAGDVAATRATTGGRTGQRTNVLPTIGLAMERSGTGSPAVATAACAHDDHGTWLDTTVSLLRMLRRRLVDLGAGNEAHTGDFTPPLTLATADLVNNYLRHSLPQASGACQGIFLSHVAAELGTIIPHLQQERLAVPPTASIYEVNALILTIVEATLCTAPPACTPTSAGVAEQDATDATDADALRPGAAKMGRFLPYLRAVVEMATVSMACIPADTRCPGLLVELCGKALVVWRHVSAAVGERAEVWTCELEDALDRHLRQTAATAAPAATAHLSSEAALTRERVQLHWRAILRLAQIDLQCAPRPQVWSAVLELVRAEVNLLCSSIDKGGDIARERTLRVLLVRVAYLISVWPNDASGGSSLPVTDTVSVLGTATRQIVLSGRAVGSSGSDRIETNADGSDKPSYSDARPMCYCERPQVCSCVASCFLLRLGQSGGSAPSPGNTAIGELMRWASGEQDGGGMACRLPSLSDSVAALLFTYVVSKKVGGAQLKALKSTRLFWGAVEQNGDEHKALERRFSGSRDWTGDSARDRTTDDDDIRERLCLRDIHQRHQRLCVSALVSMAAALPHKQLQLIARHIVAQDQQTAAIALGGDALTHGTSAAGIQGLLMLCLQCQARRQSVRCVAPVVRRMFGQLGEALDRRSRSVSVGNSNEEHRESMCIALTTLHLVLQHGIRARLEEGRCAGESKGGGSTGGVHGKLWPADELLLLVGDEETNGGAGGGKGPLRTQTQRSAVCLLLHSALDLRPLDTKRAGGNDNGCPFRAALAVIRCLSSDHSSEQNDMFAHVLLRHKEPEPQEVGSARPRASEQIDAHALPAGLRGGVFGALCDASLHWCPFQGAGVERPYEDPLLDDTAPFVAGMECVVHVVDMFSAVRGAGESSWHRVIIAIWNWIDSRMGKYSPSGLFAMASFLSIALGTRGGRGGAGRDGGGDGGEGCASVACNAANHPIDDFLRTPDGVETVTHTLLPRMLSLWSTCLLLWPAPSLTQHISDSDGPGQRSSWTSRHDVLACLSTAISSLCDAIKKQAPLSNITNPIVPVWEVWMAMRRSQLRSAADSGGSSSAQPCALAAGTGMILPLSAFSVSLLQYTKAVAELADGGTMGSAGGEDGKDGKGGKGGEDRTSLNGLSELDAGQPNQSPYSVTLQSVLWQLLAPGVLAVGRMLRTTGSPNASSSRQEHTGTRSPRLARRSLEFIAGVLSHCPHLLYPVPLHQPCAMSSEPGSGAMGDPTLLNLEYILDPLETHLLDDASAMILCRDVCGRDVGSGVGGRGDEEDEGDDAGGAGTIDKELGHRWRIAMLSASLTAYAVLMQRCSQSIDERVKNRAGLLKKRIRRLLRASAWPSEIGSSPGSGQEPADSGGGGGNDWMRSRCADTSLSGYTVHRGSQHRGSPCPPPPLVDAFACALAAPPSVLPGLAEACGFKPEMVASVASVATRDLLQLAFEEVLIPSLDCTKTDPQLLRGVLVQTQQLLGVASNSTIGECLHEAVLPQLRRAVLGVLMLTTPLKCGANIGAGLYALRIEAMWLAGMLLKLCIAAPCSGPVKQTGGGGGDEAALFGQAAVHHALIDLASCADVGGSDSSGYTTPGAASSSGVGSLTATHKAGGRKAAAAGANVVASERELERNVEILSQRHSQVVRECKGGSTSSGAGGGVGSTSGRRHVRSPKCACPAWAHGNERGTSSHSVTARQKQQPAVLATHRKDCLGDDDLAVLRQHMAQAANAALDIAAQSTG